MADPSPNAPPLTSHTPPRLPTSRQLMLKFANWNIHGLRHKVHTITADLQQYNIDIAVLTETWMPSDYTTWPASDGRVFVVFNSGHSDSGQGVAIALDSRYANSFIGHPAYVSPRHIRLRLRRNRKSMTILGVCSPQSDAPQEERDAFYTILQQQINLTPAQDFLLLAGDFNARVGRNTDTCYPRPLVIGHWGEPTQNAAGQTLISFFAHNSLRIMNTFFRHRPIQRCTFPSNGSLIDFVVTRHRDHSYFTDVRVRRGTATSSDHHMVTALMNHPLYATRLPSNRPKAEPTKRNEKLRDRAVRLKEAGTKFARSP